MGAHPFVAQSAPAPCRRDSEAWVDFHYTGRAAFRLRFACHVGRQVPGHSTMTAPRRPSRYPAEVSVGSSNYVLSVAHGRGASERSRRVGFERMTMRALVKCRGRGYRTKAMALPRPNQPGCYSNCPKSAGSTAVDRSSQSRFRDRDIWGSACRRVVKIASPRILRWGRGLTDRADSKERICCSEKVQDARVWAAPLGDHVSLLRFAPQPPTLVVVYQVRPDGTSRVLRQRSIPKPIDRVEARAAAPCRKRPISARSLVTR